MHPSRPFVTNCDLPIIPMNPSSPVYAQSKSRTQPDFYNYAHDPAVVHVDSILDCTSLDSVILTLIYFVTQI